MQILKTSNVPVKIWVENISDVESEALNQLRNMGSLPWTFRHIAVMPDVHFGKGATVGSVIAMKEAVAPAAVGVDIGCGMAAVKTNLSSKDLPDNLKKLRLDIEAEIPVGFDSHKSAVAEKLFRTGEDFKFAKKVISGFSNVTEKFQSLKTRMLYQCGTLGGGNHYIELCLDENDTVWMMLHSGSRNIGKELAEYHISIAKKLAHNESLPDRDLAVFLKGTKEMQEYRRDLLWAQEYAFLNRRVMLELYYRVMKKYFPNIEKLETVICHHNYVSEETHFGEDLIVTRKGAISARENEMGIIPGSMGTRSYIVEGLGNPESFHSASHGAGRRMSRGAAKKAYTVRDLEEQTKGIECRKDSGVLDEIPKAYKDIDKVMSFQTDLVKVRYVLRQILNIKG